MSKGKFSQPRSTRDAQSQSPEELFPELASTLAEEFLLEDLPTGVIAPEAPAEAQEPIQEPITQPPAAAPAPTPIPAAERPTLILAMDDPTELPDQQPLASGAQWQEAPEADPETAPDEVSPKVKKHKKIALISLCCAALLVLGGIVAAVSILLTRAADDGLILNNVTVAGVNLGGMTQEQAEQVLRAATKDTYSRQDMVIKLPGATITLTPAQTGAKLDVEAAAKAAYNYGRTGSRAERQKAKQQSMTGPYHIALLPYMELDTAYIRQVIEEYCAGFNSVYSESSYTLQGDRPALGGDQFDADAACQTLLLDPGSPGQDLDMEALYDRVLDAYSFNTFVVEIDDSILGDMPVPLDLDAIFAEYHTDPVDAYFDTETKTVVPETYGYTFDLEYAKELLAAAEPGTVVRVPMEYVEPERIAADFFADELSSYQTKHTNSENRNTNLRLACASINGMILLPGETFDYNQALGKRTKEAGYKAAGAYANGETVLEIGGGICQVSSTLYYCTLMADLEIVTREAHSYVSTYMPYGMDATVSWNGPDFRFRNNTEYPIRIEAEVADGYVKIRLVGTDTKDHYVKMEYEIVGWEAYETVYKEFAPDNEKGYKDGDVVSTPYAGCTVKTYRCKYDKATDELISRDFEARSQYKRRDEVIAKIVTTPTEDPDTPTEKPTEPTEKPSEPTEKPTEPSTPSENTQPPQESTAPPTEETTVPPTTEPTGSSDDAA